VTESGDLFLNCSCGNNTSFKIYRVVLSKEEYVPEKGEFVFSEVKDLKVKYQIIECLICNKFIKVPKEFDVLDLKVKY